MSAFLLLKLIDLQKKLELKYNNEKSPKAALCKTAGIKSFNLWGTSIDKICRICAKNCDSNLVSIFGEDNIVGDILKCADVTISEDDQLPKKVCEDCCSLLNNAVRFRSTCEESDKKLREGVENLKNSANHVDASADNLKNSFDDSLDFDNDDDSDRIDDYTPPTVVRDGPAAVDDWEAELHVDLHSPVGGLERRSHRCNKCDLDFPNSSEQRRHIMSAEHSLRPWRCRICVKDFGRKSLYNSHIQIHRERKYLCEICGKKCLQKHELKRHLMSHRRITPFHCPFCEYKTWDKCYLKLHETIHTGKRRYTCPHCPMKFINNTNMKRHIEKHSDPKPYHCDACDMRYTTKYALRDHKLRSHNRIYILHCTECGIEKNCKKDLQRHMIKVHRSVYKRTCVPTRGPVLYDVAAQTAASQAAGDAGMPPMCEVLR